jgi:hypothetical protein
MCDRSFKLLIFLCKCVSPRHVSFWSIFIKSFLYIRYCPNCLIGINLLNSHNKPYEVSIANSSISQRMKLRYRERYRENLPEVTQFISSRFGH